MLHWSQVQKREWGRSHSRKWEAWEFGCGPGHILWAVPSPSPLGFTLNQAAFPVPPLFLPSLFPCPSFRGALALVFPHLSQLCPFCHSPELWQRQLGFLLSWVSAFSTHAEPRGLLLTPVQVPLAEEEPESQALLGEAGQ